MQPSTHRFLWPVLTLTAFAAGLATGLQRSKSFATTDRTTESAPVVKLSGVPPVISKAEAHSKLLDTLALLNPTTRQHQLRSLAHEALAADPTTAWALQQQISSVTDKETYCVELLEAWSAKNPQDALTAAAALAPGRLHTACMTTALEGLARQDADAALKYATENLTAAARESSLNAIVHAWAERSPQAAAQWSVQNLSTPGAGGTLRAAVNSWADSNPAAASQWVAGLPSGTTSSIARSALVETWAEQSPAEVAAWISSQGVRADMDGPAEDLAAQWAATDPRAAAEWAVTLERTLTARAAAMRAVGEWAAVAPTEAATWLEQKSPEVGKISSAMYRSLASSWAGQDSVAAANWVQTIPDVWAQKESAPIAFNIWAATDQEGLNAWISNNPTTPVTDAAREQLALIQADHAPADALTAALQISNPQSAAVVGRRILKTWRSQDQLAANAWANANPDAMQLLQPTH